MFRSSLRTEEEVVQAKELISSKVSNLPDYLELEDTWLFEMKVEERELLLSLVGFDRMESGFTRPKYKSLKSYSHDNCANIDKEAAKCMLKNIDRKYLHELHGRLLEAMEIDSAVIAINYHMPLRLHKYLVRLGITDPRLMIELYEAGGYGNEMKDDIEFLFGTGLLDKYCDTDRQLVFGKNISTLPDLVIESKRKYIRIATFIRVPDDVQKKLERTVKQKYTGDIYESIEKMRDSGDFTNEEIEYLIDYQKFGASAIEKHKTVPLKRTAELMLTLNMKYL